MEIGQEKFQRLLDGIRLEPVKRSHAIDLADLHYRMLGWSFNGALGKTHMQDLYDALLATPESFGFVIYIDGRLMGFVTATVDYERTRKNVETVYRRKKAKVAWLLMRRPSAALAILESKFAVPRVYRRYDTRAEWLTFLTDRTHPFLTPFLSHKLIDGVAQEFRRRGVRHYLAQGVKNNPRAIKYYEKLKWNCIKSLLVHNIYLFEGSQ